MWIHTCVTAQEWVLFQLLNIEDDDRGWSPGNGTLSPTIPRELFEATPFQLIRVDCKLKAFLNHHGFLSFSCKTRYFFPIDIKVYLPIILIIEFLEIWTFKCNWKIIKRNGQWYQKCSEAFSNSHLENSLCSRHGAGCFTYTSHLILKKRLLKVTRLLRDGLWLWIQVCVTLKHTHGFLPHSLITLQCFAHLPIEGYLHAPFLGDCPASVAFVATAGVGIPILGPSSRPIQDACACTNGHWTRYVPNQAPWFPLVKKWSLLLTFFLLAEVPLSLPSSTTSLLPV